MRRKYEKSPIAEAVCSVTFSATDPFDLTIPGVFWERLQGKGYDKQVQENEGDAVQFLREDGQAIIRVAPHSLSIHKLAPYGSWEEFTRIINVGIETYLGVAQPMTIVAIALRYLNRIEVVGNTVTLEDYFEFYPQLGKDLPQDHAAFIAGVQVPFDAPEGVLRLQLASAREQTPGHMSMVLDIAYVRTSDFEASSDAIMPWLEGAHKRIEDAFEGSIKDGLRDVFGEVK